MFSLLELSEDHEEDDALSKESSDSEENEDDS
jgi:hypothetical protein